MRDEPLGRRGDAYVLPLAGMRVERCCVSVGCIEYNFEDRELPTTLSIFQRFFVTRWKQEWAVDPLEMESVQPALLLVGKTLVDATASADGTLGLRQPEGSVRAGPAPQAYRTWLFQRGDGLNVFCSAEGLVMKSISDARGARRRMGKRGQGG